MSETTTNPSAADVKHTPGPWHIEKMRGAVQEYRVSSDDPDGNEGFVIAQCPVTAQGEANARLIAAAPELLDALRALVDGLDAAMPVPLAEMLPQESAAARAALAKAGAL